jgi:norsolorinic acid ketoreductase
MASNKVYLITGGSRGIGRGLVATFLSRPSTTVIVALRNRTPAIAADLTSLPTGTSSRLIIIKIDSLSDTDALDATAELRAEYGIHEIDVLIANAGIDKTPLAATETPVSFLRDTLEANTLGPFKLFQGIWPLLKISKTPKFIALSSVLGSLNDVSSFPLQCTAYGASKAALNYILRKIDQENPNLVAVAINPG